MMTNLPAVLLCGGIIGLAFTVWGTDWAFRLMLLAGLALAVIDIWQDRR